MAVTAWGYQPILSDLHVAYRLVSGRCLSGIRATTGVVRRG